MRVVDGRIWKEISEFECFTPPLPDRLEDCENWDLPVKEQYYRKMSDRLRDDPELSFMKNIRYKQAPGSTPARPKYTDELDLTERQRSFIDAERRKIWVTGVWVMIKGVPYWINGYHYFVLNYWHIGAETDDGMKEYREWDMWKWLFWWNVQISDTEIGCIIFKHRRAGETVDGWAINFLEAQAEENALCGHVNLTLDDGNDSMKDIGLTAFLKVPIWLKYSNNARPDAKEVKFTSYVRGTKDKMAIANSSEDSLDSRVFVASTTMKSFVGKKMKQIVVDEFLLWDLDLFTWMNRNKKGVTLGAGRIKNGNIFIVSTSGGDDEKKTVLNDRAQDFVTKCRRSHWSDKLGRTSTGVRAFFTPATWRLEGFIGKYGEPIIHTPTEEQKKNQRIKHPRLSEAQISMGAEEFILDQLQHAKVMEDWKEYYGLKTLYPLTWDDPFTRQSDVQIFNTDKLDGAMMNIQVRSVAHKNLVQVGNLQWKNIYDKKEVEFCPNKQGKFEWSYFPKLEDQNRVQWQGDQAIPMNGQKGCTTWDPYEKGILVNGAKGSKGAGHGLFFLDFDGMNMKYEDGGIVRPGHVDTPSLFFKYKARPKDIDDFYEDAIMASHFMSMRMAFESNKPGMAQYFIDRGYEKFVYKAKDFKDPQLDAISAEDSARYGLVVGAQNINSLINNLARWVNGTDLLFRGHDFDISQELRRIPFLETLMDLSQFDYDPAKRTKCDLTMSLLPGIQIAYLKMKQEYYGRKTRQDRFDEKNGTVRSMLDMVLEIERNTRRDLGRQAA